MVAAAAYALHSLKPKSLQSKPGSGLFRLVAGPPACSLYSTCREAHQHLRRAAQAFQLIGSRRGSSDAAHSSRPSRQGKERLTL